MKKFLTLLALLALLVGCATSPRPTSPKIAELISSPTIARELQSMMDEGDKIFFMDWRFVSIPEDRTRRLISEAFVGFDTRYVVEARDCDDISNEYLARLRALFRRELNNSQAAAPVGLIGGAVVGDIPELNLYLHGGEPVLHAMVVVRCYDGKWLLVEPSKKRVVELESPYYEDTFRPMLVIF